ncbi:MULTISPECIES: NADH:flavin oxidoreductase [unclassified Halomonas]|uniref:NADH:flavin oxidoreductase n=1 Tax=unclassified Halomonas TaxID=2609666 RepID=UPI0007DA47E9|nr:MULTISPECIES: NADH:flavin oxidoreductase [unclassified Halomonas]MBT2788420.1 NADH:flavin oxidoreductase [Halomonas sp. ISL-106]MBT2798011.1 NADH:flavin oxidoreductase [Halomonas sp. ISL-104]OAL60579.1 12-oxophytodienoate reductase [Halomonas sp. ALS9]
MSNDILFTPFTLKGLTLPNRIVMAPMTRAMAEGGIPGASQAEYYRRRAIGGVGLILTEGTVVNRPAARNMPGIPLFHSEPALAGWAEVANAVHAVGGLIGPQLWHTGSIPVPQEAQGWQPDGPAESPSGLVSPATPHGVAMSEEDIADSVAAFASAALDAKRLGFDTLELHGAHGYLIDQFFWPGTNTRNDAFGGATIGERSRFAAEIVRAVRVAVGPDFPLILRVSQWKQQDYSARLATSPQEMTEWLAPLVEAGVDILHCSQRRFWEPEFAEIDGAEGLNFAGWAKKLTGAATISVGSVGLDSDFFGAFGGVGSGAAALDSLHARMEREEFDLIAVGRVLISDPQWVNKVRTGQLQELRGFAAEDLASLA